MVCPFFTDKHVINYDVAKTANTERFRTVFRRLLDYGVNIAPSPFEGWFVSIVHSDEDIDLTIAAHRAALEKL